MGTMNYSQGGRTVEVETYNDPRQIPELLERIRSGNRKLNDAFTIYMDITDPNQKADAWDKFYIASLKLQALCDQLTILGYNDCLYIKDGKRYRTCGGQDNQLGCRVCPSKREYWLEENPQGALL